MPTAAVIAPATPENILAIIKGFLNFKLTPYIAGSVIPVNTAETAADYAIDFKYLSFVFKNTPKQAPA